MSGGNIKVVLRCRPFSEDELRNNAPQVVTCYDDERKVGVSQNPDGKQTVFTFDMVFGPAAPQTDLYEQAVIPIVKDVLEGFECTIFAYGHTGTGKTYTMEGECKRSKSGPNVELPPNAGVIPRAVQQIFDALKGQNAEYSVTFLELYNEVITDLLAPNDKQKEQLAFGKDGEGRVLVKGLKKEIVTSASQIFTLLERGSAKRRTAETLVNKQSSRSHSLFSITIRIEETTPEGEKLIKRGKLNLVDLAGSESISRSGAMEGRAKEAGEINKSLLTLGRVIDALVQKHGHIPCRDSKLTQLLRDSLGGKTKTCIIATVSPAVHCLNETLSTLHYAHKAKNITNKPEVLVFDKPELYAAPEKNGVYMPKEQCYQAESKKKQFEELRAKLAEVLKSSELSIELGPKVKELESKFRELEQEHKRNYSTYQEKIEQLERNLREREYSTEFSLLRQKISELGEKSREQEKQLQSLQKQLKLQEQEQASTITQGTKVCCDCTRKSQCKSKRCQCFGKALCDASCACIARMCSNRSHKKRNRSHNKRGQIRKKRGRLL